MLKRTALLLAAGMLAAPAAGQNLLLNGSFENGNPPTSWVYPSGSWAMFADDLTDFGLTNYDGDQVLTMSSPGEWAWVDDTGFHNFADSVAQQTIPVQGGETYRVVMHIMEDPTFGLIPLETGFAQHEGDGPVDIDGDGQPDERVIEGTIFSTNLNIGGVANGQGYQAGELESGWNELVFDVEAPAGATEGVLSLVLGSQTNPDVTPSYVYVDAITIMRVDVEVPVCPADWNEDEVVNVQDLLAYLNAFRTGDADMNDDDVTNVQDLLAYLNAFRAGCPDA